MNRCKSVVMRKSLEAVDSFKEIGLDFVPVPVLNEEHKKRLLIQAADSLDEIIKAVELS